MDLRIEFPPVDLDWLRQLPAVDRILPSQPWNSGVIARDDGLLPVVQEHFYDQNYLSKRFEMTIIG